MKPMYKTFYGFHEEPFNVTSDPEFFFSSTRHVEAFSHLIYAIEHRKGIVVITGEIGTGKTTLCRTLLTRLDPKIKSALILNPYFSDSQLLQLIIKDLGIEGKFKNKLELVNALNEFLIHESSQGHNVVLIIDEAQNLGVRQLEQIRLLSNLETEKAKLLQIVLVGQPELLAKLQLPSLRQLNQRITVRFHMLPLHRDEVGNYVHHRIKIACRATNGHLPVAFTPHAIETIYRHSQGTPRLINILCDRALLSGYVQETKTIDKDVVDQCVQEMQK
ncbi:MAG: AAA family ATPase [Candidatus Omnitrophica bacterium]|nr:AAA family ATPase [Candidatus Omnitrophota bacterium]